ncbi:conserved hypothetical protein [Echinococcus multilocularis]|uniref:Uncharacterized protein n=1 Tax=Echinococcus multilocularis TaxID=6211 RepID=A0A068XTR5_ECHMU|nr:conserved hypothetical protein [Echinococcus multilocularis]
MTPISLTFALTLFLICTIPKFGSVIPPTSTTFHRDENKQWILAGLSLIRRLDCTHVTSISRQDCVKIRVSPASRFVAYVAKLEHKGLKYLVMTHPEVEEEEGEEVKLPAQGGNLTGVLVLDPLADRAFGHPLFIFRIVAFAGSREEQLRQCLDHRGLMYRSECIHQEVKSGCPHVFLSAGQLEEDSKFPQVSGVCEYQFLPRVTTTNSTKNLLQCVPHAAPCLSAPQQRQRRRRLHRRRVLVPAYLYENLIWSSDPQWINPLTRREVGNSFPPQRPIRLTTVSSKSSQYSSKPDDGAICSPYDRLGEKEHIDTSINRRQQKRHLVDKMRSLGFTASYLSVFPPEERPPTSYHFFDIPVRQKATPKNISIKAAFRTRMQKLCHTPRCVSTLFLYLNNFVLPNGDMLVGGDKLISPNERYSVSELLSDLSGCQASLVFALVDQNFGGILLEGLKSRPTEFTNLVLLSATRQASALRTERTAVERPLQGYFYPHYYAYRLGHYDLYGVEDLLTYAVENLPLSQMIVGDIEEQVKFLYPHLELGSFYGSRVQAHASSLFTKPLVINQHEGGFLQGHRGLHGRVFNSAPRSYVAGCVSLSPVDWLRNYLPSTEQSQRH